MVHAPASALAKFNNPFCLNGDVGVTKIEQGDMSDEGWSVKWLWFPRRPFGMKPSAAGRTISASIDSGICRIPVGLKFSTWASAIALGGGCLHVN
jgi:hypothetical protein